MVNIFNPVLTGKLGNNSDLMEEIFRLYVPKNCMIADVTYGKGVFWKKLQESDYKLLKSDIINGIDLRKLPYENRSIDRLILDPPYAHGGITMKASINDCYGNNNTTHESIIRLYTAGILEASRVLKIRGLIIIKTQDEIESGKQRWTHIELIQILELLGFVVIDLFILLQSSIPAMREQYQKTARKNHSYAIIARLRN